MSLNLADDASRPGFHPGSAMGSQLCDLESVSPYRDFGLLVCKTDAGGQLSHHCYSNWKKIIPGLYALEVLPLEDVCVYETYLAF